MNKKEVTSDQSFEKNRSIVHKSYDVQTVHTSPKNRLKMFVLHPKMLQNISLNAHIAGASTSNQKQHELDNNLLADIKSSHKNKIISKKQRVNPEIENAVRKNERKGKFENEVPKSCRLATSQKVEREIESVPKCLNNDASGTIEVPDRYKKTYQRKRINDHATPNNPSQVNVLTDDKKLSIEKQNQNEASREQHSCSVDQTVEDQNVENVQSDATATPAEPTETLPSDPKASVEVSNEEKIQSTESSTVQSVLSSMLNGVAQKDDVRKQEAQDTLSTIPIKRKRGRPRKIINNSIDQDAARKDNDILQEMPNIESATCSKRRSSRIRTNINVSSEEEDDVADIIGDTSLERKQDGIESEIDSAGGRGHGRGRGRGRGHGRGRGRGGRGRGRGRGRGNDSLDIDYIPKSRGTSVSQSPSKNNKANVEDLNTTNVENAETDSNVSHTEKDVQLVTCAKCNQQVSKRQWASHNLFQHNDMAWQENEEPLNLENDTKLLKQILKNALKKKKKSLVCEQCAATKRSVNGFISHMQFCGKSEEVKFNNK